MLIDLHSHTYPKSDDSFLSPAQLIHQAKRVGLDGICLTEHDRFWDSESIAVLSHEYDFPIFPGCEVTTEDGHLLVFGLDRYIFGMHRAALVNDLVDRAGGAIVVAHRYRRLYQEGESSTDGAYDSMLDRGSGSSLFSLDDAVETLNGRGSDTENAFSLEVANRFNIRGVGSSDAHSAEDIGTFATDFLHPVRALAGLIHQLKAGSFQPAVLDNLPAEQRVV